MGKADPMSSSSYYKTLLLALGLFQVKHTPQTLDFTVHDPMAEGLCKVAVKTVGRAIEKGSCVECHSAGLYKISPACEELVDQVFNLNSTEEVLEALNRIATATQTLTSRLILLTVIAGLCHEEPKSVLFNLKSLELLKVESFCRLLRLVHAGRVSGTPGESLHVPSSSFLHSSVKALDCLSDAIAAMIVDEGTSSADDLMQSCSRDLFAAAVGGAKLSERWTGLVSPHGDKSDVSIMANPNFEVTQSLVQIVANSVSKLALFSHGLVWLVDALAACLFSSKLQSSHKLWALEQLVKILAATSDVPGTTTTSSSSAVVRGDHHPSSRPPGTKCCLESQYLDVFIATVV